MRNVGLDKAQAEIKIVRRNINNLRYAGDNHPYGRKWRRTKEPLDESERGGWKVGLKLNIQKTKIMAIHSITSWQINGETMETVADFILGALKPLQMVSAAMKVKDICCLEESLWPT